MPSADSSYVGNEKWKCLLLEFPMFYGEEVLFCYLKINLLILFYKA